MRLTKRDLRYLVWDINNRYMSHWMNRYLSMIVSSRSYTPNIIELVWYWNDRSILHRRFTTIREAWNYLIWVQDWLDVL